MANMLYAWGRDGFANALISWTSDTIKMVPCDSGYVPNLATDKFLSDISHTVATAQPITTKSTLAGVCSGDSVTFTGITSGVIVTQYVIYKDTGTAGTSRLIGHINVTAPNPVTSNGGPINLNPTGGVYFEL